MENTQNPWRPKFALRWVIEYANRPRKAGMWGMSTRNPSDSAWAQPRDGITRAVIEGKDLVSRQIVRLAECPGEDYRIFQWVATAALPGLGVSGSVTLRSRLVGLKILTRDKCIEVHGDGKPVIRKLTDSETKINFRSF